MNIQGISDNLQPDRAAKAGQLSTGPVHPLVRRAGSDRVDMSRLSKLMAKSAKDLKSQLSARASCVQAFDNKLEDRVVLSDTVVDTILSRMAGD